MTLEHPVPDFLAPIAADRFFAEHWGRKRLIVRRGDPGYFRDIIGLPELDRLVTSLRIPSTNFNLAQDNDPLPFSAYCSSGSFVDKQRALTLHHQGATVILRSVEQWSPDLNRLRAAAEAFFRCEAQINVYLTPPSQKSTPPHWDTHDLVVLQIEGSKRWRLYAGARTLPLGDERFRVGEDLVGEVLEEVVLHAGDTMYLPRGVIHEPVAEVYSAHVSIGLHTPRLYDLLDVALRLLAEREGSPLREAVPIHAPLERLPDVDLLRDLLDPDLLRSAAAVLGAAFARTRAVDLEGRLLEIRRGPRLDDAVRYARRAGLGWQISAVDGGLRITVGDQHITVPANFRNAVDHILTHASFTAAELPVAEPATNGVALCLGLQEIGALKIVDPERAP